MHTDVYLARAVHRVETLFFEDHGDSQRFQFPRVFQAVNGISGKSGHRLGDYHVDIAFSALPDHFHELRSALRLGAAQSLVREYASHCPFGIAHDLIGVIIPLCFKAHFLFVGISGYTAVGRYPELSEACPLFLRFDQRWDFPDCLDALCDLLHCDSPFLSFVR